MSQLINYPHIASMVFGQPLLATREAVDSVKALLEPRMLGKLIESDSNNLSIDAVSYDQEREVKSLQVHNRVAVIPVHGLLAARRGHITAACTELVSYEYLRNQITAALAHEMVEEVVLDFQTGGGMAVGCQELADFIYESRQVKPITALINFSAYSAGYYLASACSNIICSPTGGVGSIGVIIETFEVSKYEEELGIKYNTFFRGGHKNDFSPHEPISDQATDQINKRLDRAYSLFTESVAKYRDIDVSTVVGTEARLLEPSEALSLGLIDSIVPAQDAINSIVQTYSAQTKRSKSSIRARASAIDLTTQL